MTLLGIIASSRLTAAPVAGYVAWYDAADTSTITASGGDVSQWNDKSTNGYHFTQATGAAQPKTGTRTINSKNTLDFDGSSDFMSIASSTSYFNFIHSSTGATIFFVGEVDTISSYGTIFTNNNGGSSVPGVFYAVEQSASKIEHYLSGSSLNNVAYILEGAITNGTPFYTTAKFDGGNATAANRIKQSMNGGAFVGSNTNTSAATSNNAGHDLHLGRQSTTAGSYYNGKIAEIIIYSGILSGSDITANQSYLAAKWGL